MKYDQFSRRMFLRGSGNSVLAIPLLTSLLGSKVEAQVLSSAPLRFIMFGNWYSPTQGFFYGNLKSGLSQTAGNVLMSTVNYRPLSSVSGDLSWILQPLTSIKNKVNVLRGVNQSFDDGVHAVSIPTCGIGSNTDRSDIETISQKPSVDYMIGKAAQTYPNGVLDSRRNIVSKPGYADYLWSGSYATPMSRCISPTTSTSTLLSRFSGGFTPPAMAPTGVTRRNILSSVYQDYLNVKNDSRLGSADKVKLDRYLAMVSDLQTSLAATTTTTTAAQACANPVLATESATANRAAYDIEIKNHILITALAMACDLTRVAAFTIDFDGNTDWHACHHNEIGSTAGAQPATASATALAYYEQFQHVAAQVALMAKTLDSMTDTAGGTMLDNSIIYWAQQYGLFDNDPSGFGHTCADNAIVVAGGGGGRLSMGNYIDYSAGGSAVTMNNLLVTFMNCFGLTSTDYEYAAGVGYGKYATIPKIPATSLTTAAKRTALPFLYKGPVLT